MTDKQPNRKLLGIFLIVLIVAALGAVTWALYEPFSILVQDPDRLRAWIDSFGAGRVLIFAALVVLQIVFAVIPGEPLEIAAGVLFGPWFGTVLFLAGAAMGTFVVLLLTRRYGRKIAAFFFSHKDLDSLRFLQNTKRLEIWAFVLFLLPGTPKDLLTWFAGLTPIKPRRFILLTVFARIPSVISSALGGHELLQGNWQLALLIFGGAGAAAGLGYLCWRLILRRRGGVDK